MKNKIILILGFIGILFNGNVSANNISLPQEPSDNTETKEYTSDIVYSLYAVPNIEKPVTEDDVYPEIDKDKTPDIKPPMLKYAPPNINGKDYSVKKYAIFDINKEMYADKDEIPPGLSEEEFLKLLNKKYKHKAPQHEILPKYAVPDNKDTK